MIDYSQIPAASFVDINENVCEDWTTQLQLALYKGKYYLKAHDTAYGYIIAPYDKLMPLLVACITHLPYTRKWVVVYAHCIMGGHAGKVDVRTRACPVRMAAKDVFRVRTFPFTPGWNYYVDIWIDPDINTTLMEAKEKLKALEAIK